MREWLWSRLQRDMFPAEGSGFRIGDAAFVVTNGIPRSEVLYSAAPKQTEEVFGFERAKRETFESEAARGLMRNWAYARYGDPHQWIARFGRPLVLDAGCGAAYTAGEYFGPVLDRIRYFGADIWMAVEVARDRMQQVARDRMQHMSPAEGWQAVMPLNKLGMTLGDLDIEINSDDPIDLLEIPVGHINLQRLFYWHIFKAFYRPDYSLDEMNHINFDWYAPRNAHRQTVEEVRAWCAQAGLEIEREQVEEAGISVVARRAG